MINYQPQLSPTNGEYAPPQAFSVSEINAMVSDVLSANISGVLSVEGEISNLSVAGSGHRYFSLKDSNSTISCALFRGAANRISREVLRDLSNGDKVVVKANLSVYQPSGRYQLIVTDVEPAGFGALAKAFAALKQKLDNAGYTAQARKRQIPEWASAIAVVTSATGAAVRDVLTTLERRAPFIPVSVFPTLVQGQNAPAQIVEALADANNHPTASVIVLVRGGGSLEDLQAFNDESVAMAVVNSHLPVVTGVGHETDFTIVDFVSDARAPTPTAAAEWVSPDKVALSASLQKQQQRLLWAGNHHLSQRRKQLDTLARRLSLQHPQANLQQQSQRLDELTSRLQRALTQRLANRRQQVQHLQRRLASVSPQQKHKQSQAQLNEITAALSQVMQQRLAQSRGQLSQSAQRLMRYPQRFEQNKQQLKGLSARLQLLSPLGVLGRGYALAFDDNGQLLRDADSVSDSDKVRIRLAKGELYAKITATVK